MATTSTVPQAAVLGVEHSIGGRRWVARGADGQAVERSATALMQRFGLPEPVARLLAARGVPLDEAEAFLDPSLKSLMPDPSTLRDVDAAVARLARAVRDGETVGVFADYDVDGATSAALLIRYLRSVGVGTVLHVPDRMTEGYGPNIDALEGLVRRGAGLVVTVDCGIAGFEPLAAAAERGIDVVVIDHHMAEADLPRAVAVVDPNRLDEPGGLGHLAACGVVFLVLVALNRALRESGMFRDRREPDLLALLDLVALGTVADVVPLTGLNRAYVTRGLAVMARRGNPGLAALADVARMDSQPGTYHLGYLLGPRINAGGRVGQSDLGARLLTTDDGVEARRLAEALDRYNEDRRDIEAAVLDDARRQVEERQADAPVLLVAGDRWHPGVIGIVAGRLKESFGRPACVVAWEGTTGRGSGRSVAGFALGPAVIAAHQAGLLVAGGGHAMAAGFTLRRDRLDAFHDFLMERFAADGATDLAPTLDVDGTVTPSGANRGLVDALARAGPYGAGNPEPCLVIPGARVVRADPVGQNHVRCLLASGDGGRLKGIAFRAMDGALGPALLGAKGRPMHLAGSLRPDDWQGREAVQLFIEDAAECG